MKCNETDGKEKNKGHVEWGTGNDAIQRWEKKQGKNRQTASVIRLGDFWNCLCKISSYQDFNDYFFTLK